MRLLLLATVLVSGLAFSQAVDPPRTSEMTIVGCLSMGTAPNQFILVEDPTGRQTEVSGPVNFAKHASGHKVQLTGHSTVQAGKSTFHATKLEHISDTCEAKRK